MNVNKLISDLLDSFGVLDTEHERLCAAIAIDSLDRAKFRNLSTAIAEYQRVLDLLLIASDLPEESSGGLGPKDRLVSSRYGAKVVNLRG